MCITPLPPHLGQAKAGHSGAQTWRCTYAGGRREQKFALRARRHRARVNTAARGCAGGVGKTKARTPLATDGTSASYFAARSAGWRRLNNGRERQTSCWRQSVSWPYSLNAADSRAFRAFRHSGITFARGVNIAYGVVTGAALSAYLGRRRSRRGARHGVTRARVRKGDLVSRISGVKRARQSVASSKAFQKKNRHGAASYRFRAHARYFHMHLLVAIKANTARAS